MSKEHSTPKESPRSDLNLYFEEEEFKEGDIKKREREIVIDRLDLMTPHRSLSSRSADSVTVRSGRESAADWKHASRDVSKRPRLLRHCTSLNQ